MGMVFVLQLCFATTSLCAVGRKIPLNVDCQGPPRRVSETRKPRGPFCLFFGCACVHRVYAYSGLGYSSSAFVTAPFISQSWSRVETPADELLPLEY